MLYRLGWLFVFFITLLLLAKYSQAAGFKQGLVKGKLKPCPSTPNCISSEDGMIGAINIDGMEPGLAWDTFKQTIVKHKGNIQTESNDYLWAVFKTSVLGFADDVEARLDTSNKQIHLRSASRVGYYDFGANRKRLNMIINAMKLSSSQKSFNNPHE